MLYNHHIEPPLALTFDDVSVYPRGESDIPSRTDPRVSLRSRISPNIALNLPIVSSYMDTVTEHQMAITLARLGGLGIIHRWMTIEDQVEQVKLVKREENRVIEEPYAIAPNTTVGEAQKLLRDLNVGALLVTDEEHKLLGVVSTRDVELRERRGDSVTHVMTQRDDLVVMEGNPFTISTERATRLLIQHRKEKIPIVDEDNVVRGMVSKKDIKKLRNRLAVRDSDDHLRCGAAIGLAKDDYLERAEALLDAGADLIVLAIANGYLTQALEAVRSLRAEFGDRIDLAAGCTTEYFGTKRLFEAGADTVLVGIGPGSICETRRVAGVGIPQFTALRWAQEAAREEGKFVVSDGGVHEPGQFNKALFAGASGVVCGSAFAGTDEAPGELVPVNGQQMKFNRGLASEDAKRKLDEVTGKTREIDKENYWEYVYKHVEAEGIESGFVPYSGSAIDVVRRMTGGLRSMMSYLGTPTIPELWRVADRGQYVRVTNAGHREGSPHHINVFRS